MRRVPGRFDAEPSRDDFDYIYNAQDLIELSGRKYHGKRNHISKFTRAFPDWQYEHIDDSNTEECINASLEWCKQNGCSENSPYRHELCAIHKALRERKSLGIIGGLIRIDGKVVALTLGERLNKDTFVTHFEKALGGFEEAYTLINREFAARSLGEYRYINREEDLGIEGLRKAKLSYKPAILLEKFNVTER